MQKCIRYMCVVLAISFLAIGICIKSFNFSLWGIMLLYSNNIIYCFGNIKERILLFIFHITIFVFLLSRPVISFFRGVVWWKEFGEKHVIFSLIAIGISLLGLFCGGIIAEQYLKAKKKKQTDFRKTNNVFLFNLRCISEICFYISFIFFMLRQIEKLIFMSGRSYVEFYTSFSSQLPTWVYWISVFMPYSMCVFLSTKPKKNRSFLILFLYVLSAVPDLIIGVRNPIMLHMLFAFLYYFIRDAIGDSEKWITKYEKSIVCIISPLVLIFMSAYSYLRSGLSVSKNFINLLVEFFYGQGVTFNVLAIGHKCIPELPERMFRNYTFGGILDYIMHGNIACKFFGAEALDSRNSVKNALMSNSFAHNMSYIAMPDEYLKGRGWGSSYILETYVDYGYIGVAIFSIILGFLLLYFIRLINKSTLLSTIALISMTEIFFAPRAEAMGWFTFIFTIQFWMAMAVIYFAAALCVKNYRRKI